MKDKLILQTLLTLISYVDQLRIGDGIAYSTECKLSELEKEIELLIIEEALKIKRELI